MAAPCIEHLSAVTLATRNMAAAVRFYQTLGFDLKYGGAQAEFTCFTVGTAYLNLSAEAPPVQPVWWGRAIFHVSDVDAFYARALAQGLAPQAPPRNAPWGERFFHLTDPDGHELSFARPL